MVMKISISCAMAKNRVIGVNNQLPWQLPADLKHFKKITLHKSIIMGRKTFESIGKALPDRENFVVTKDRNYDAPHCKIVNSIGEALNKSNTPEVIIIGGASIYKQAMQIANTIYLTIIHKEFEGDTFFPEIDMEIWEEISREDYKADENNPYDYSFVTLNRR